MVFKYPKTLYLYTKSQLSQNPVFEFLAARKSLLLRFWYFHNQKAPLLTWRSVNPVCSFCSLEFETNYHFLCICPHYSELRMTLLGHRILNLRLLYDFSVSQLLQFILASNRFSWTILFYPMIKFGLAFCYACIKLIYCKYNFVSFWLLTTIKSCTLLFYTLN